jgi:hypothetical protein
MTGRRTWLALAAAWTVAGVTLVLWLGTTPIPQLREELQRWQFWSLEACLVALVSCGVVLARAIRRELTRRDLAVMGAAAAFAVVLTVFVAARTNRIYYDEQIYQSIGQNLSDLRRAQMCNDGIVEYGKLQCQAGEYNKQPYAYPHLLSVVYRIAGVHMRWAFVVNAVVAGLTACALYLAALFLFRDRTAAGFASLIVSLLPQQILWSATAASEPSAALACVVALGGTAYFVQARSTAALCFAAVAAAYAVQFRPESLLILPVLAGLLWTGARDEWSRPRLWWAGLLFLGLVAIHLGHTVAVRNEGWGTTDARLSLAYLEDNLRVNGRFYVADGRFPVAITVLALIGVAVRRQRAACAVLAGYFALFFGIYLLFYAGSYNYGADVRYSLMTHPPLVLLAGLGSARLAGWLQNQAGTIAPARLVAAGLLVQLLWYLPLMRATTEEAWAARADVRFAESVVPLLRGNSYVLTHNPNMFHVWGVNAGQMSVIVNNPSYVDYLTMRYAGGVYLHWNFWCNVPVPAQQELCRQALAGRPAQLFRDLRERDQHFAFYRLQPAQPIDGQ